MYMEFPISGRKWLEARHYCVEKKVGTEAACHFEHIGTDNAPPVGGTHIIGGYLTNCLLHSSFKSLPAFYHPNCPLSSIMPQEPRSSGSLRLTPKKPYDPPSNDELRPQRLYDINANVVSVIHADPPVAILLTHQEMKAAAAYQSCCPPCMDCGLMVASMGYCEYTRDRTFGELHATFNICKACWVYSWANPLGRRDPAPTVSISFLSLLLGLAF